VWRDRVGTAAHFHSAGGRTHFRVAYQRQYPHAEEEVVYSERFKTPEEAQKFIDEALRAQRIYRSLQDQKK
jgi:hypothetical protein